MFIEDDPEKKRTRSPDAFLPTWSRRSVVLLGVLLILGGAAAIAAILVLIPPFTERQLGNGNTSLVLLTIGVAVVGYGVVCLFKRPTAGSEPGSPRYEELIEKERRSRRNAPSWYFLRGAAVFAAIGVVLLMKEPSSDGLFGEFTLLVGVGALVVAALLGLESVAWRRGWIGSSRTRKTDRP